MCCIGSFASRSSVSVRESAVCPGHPEHYISGNAVESRLPRLDNKFLRLLCVVEPPELFQLVILKRLHAYGNAVHACPPHYPEGLRRSGRGVAFCGNLRSWNGADRLQNPRHVLRHEVRSSSSEIHRVKLLRIFPEIPYHRRGVVLQEVAAPRRGVEIAVGALPHAERNVDIKPAEITHHRA